MLISNIKCSCIIEVSDKWKFEIKQLCDKNKLLFKERGNIVVIKPSFSICIIEKKKTCEGKKYLHINVTGNRNFKVLKSNLDFMFKTLVHPLWKVYSIAIDNICATFKFESKINLRLLHSVLKVSTLNFERFPAVFYKKYNGTFLIFESGKVNILGCKTIKDIQNSWDHIYPFLTYSEKEWPR